MVKCVSFLSIHRLRSVSAVGFVVLLVWLLVVGGATSATKENVCEYVAFIHAATAAAAMS